MRIKSEGFVTLNSTIGDEGRTLEIYRRFLLRKVQTLMYMDLLTICCRHDGTNSRSQDLTLTIKSRTKKRNA